MSNRREPRRFSFLSFSTCKIHPRTNVETDFTPRVSSLRGKHHDGNNRLVRIFRDVYRGPASSHPLHRSVSSRNLAAVQRRTWHVGFDRCCRLAPAGSRQQDLLLFSFSDDRPRARRPRDVYQCIKLRDGTCLLRTSLDTDLRLGARAGYSRDQATPQKRSLRMKTVGLGPLES